MLATIIVIAVVVALYVVNAVRKVDNDAVRREPAPDAYVTPNDIGLGGGDGGGCGGDAG